MAYQQDTKEEYGFLSMENGERQVDGFFVDRAGRVIYWPSRRAPGYVMTADQAQDYVNQTFAEANAVPRWKWIVAAIKLVFLFIALQIFGENFTFANMFGKVSAISETGIRGLGVLVGVSLLAVLAITLDRYIFARREKRAENWFSAYQKIHKSRPQPIDWVDPDEMPSTAKQFCRKFSIAGVWVIVFSIGLAMVYYWTSRPEVVHAPIGDRLVMTVLGISIMLLPVVTSKLRNMLPREGSSFLYEDVKSPTGEKIL